MTTVILGSVFIRKIRLQPVVHRLAQEQSHQARLAIGAVQHAKFGLLRLLDKQDLEGIQFKSYSDARRVDQFHCLGHCMETRRELLYTYSTTAEH
jgi:hypothetical protein